MNSLKLSRVAALGFGLAIVSSGCATPEKEKNEALIGKIKRVAVVAFAVSEPAPRVAKPKFRKKTLHDVDWESVSTESSDHANQMYLGLQEKMANHLHWTVLSQHSMIENAGYQAAFNRTMRGRQQKAALGQGQKKFSVEKVMDWDSVEVLGPEGRDTLITALGVDSIVVARVDVLFSHAFAPGSHPALQSRVTYQVYSPGVPKAVWFDGAVGGDKASELVGKTAFFDEDALKRLAVKSANSAFDLIGNVSRE